MRPSTHGESKEKHSARHNDQGHTYLAVLLLNAPPVIDTTIDVPHATIAPPSSSAWLLLNVPPSIVHSAPPTSLLAPEQYICTLHGPRVHGCTGDGSAKAKPHRQMSRSSLCVLH